MQRELDAVEMQGLVTRLEEGVAATARGFRIGAVWVSALFFSIGAYHFVVSQWEIGLLCVAAGVVTGSVGLLAAHRNKPERMLPVLEAVRVQPELVVRVRHTTTSDSRGVFVTHWITVSTADRYLMIKANHDWQRLTHLLARRCPHATVEA
jgi:hypothetical protein